MGKKKISLRGVNIPAFLGVRDSNLRAINRYFGDSKVVLKGEELHAYGEPDALVQIEKIILILKEKLKSSGQLEEMDVIEAIEAIKNGNGTGASSGGSLVIFTPKKRIEPKTPNQEAYLRAILDNDVVIGIGPAGTGKTFLAVAMALKFLREKKVERLILTRPAVEAGESLGYLPGDFEEKISPYLTPLYDALYSMMPYDRVRKLIDTRVIEIAPLAYMRGRTLSDAFIILDEAQNTKTVQMKMFLTRLGPRSKVVITGDITQIDLPKFEESGLIEIQKILKNIKGIAFVRFGPEDVIRHRLVKRIIEAYDNYYESKELGRDGQDTGDQRSGQD